MQRTLLIMFDALGSRLRASLQRLGGKGRISEADLEAGLAEIRGALLDADVALPVTTQLVDAMRTRAVGDGIVGGLGAGDRLVSVVHGALTEALGGSGRELDLRERPASILLLGLQGAGKTTTAAKLALTPLPSGSAGYCLWLLTHAAPPQQSSWRYSVKPSVFQFIESRSEPQLQRSADVRLSRRVGSVETF